MNNETLLITGYFARLLVGVMVAFYIWKDTCSRTERVRFFSVWAWVVVGVWGGLWVALIYWIIHYGVQCPGRAPTSESEHGKPTNAR